MTARKLVTASMNTVLHTQRTKGEDNSIVIVEFENGVPGVAENSWAKHGGMDDKAKYTVLKVLCMLICF